MMAVAKIANLFVVGAAKAGTTALCRALAVHPSIYFPEEKEPHYFIFPANGSASGLVTGVTSRGSPIERTSLVRSLDKYASLYRAGSGARYRGDGSTQYFVSDLAARQIANAVPEARIIIQLREPVERAWSAYVYGKVKGLERATFGEAIREEVSGGRFGRFYGGYLNTSVYGVHVSRYLEQFGRERVHICYFEDFVRDPQYVLDGVFDFLGVCRVNIPRNVSVGNATLVTSNLMLQRIRFWGTSLRARYAWIARQRMARKVHEWILRCSARPNWAMSEDESSYFRTCLAEASSERPLSSVISDHPYEGV